MVAVERYRVWTAMGHKTLGFLFFLRYTLLN